VRQSLTREEIAKLPDRRGVGIMLLNRQNQVFVAQRIDTAGDIWQMPQGGINEGEDPRAAALRELEEETAVRSVEFLAESRDWLRYDLPLDLVPRRWGGRYRGQTQKWFALRFAGHDAEINTDTPHPEFTSWKWVNMGDLPEIIVPFKRQLYWDLVLEFGHLSRAGERNSDQA